MQCLWLISILLLSSLSEGRRGKPGRQKGRPGNRMRRSLYSRIKKDLHGVEKRIQGELGQIVDTVTELKDMMEDALIDSEEIEEVEPAPETIDDNYEEDEYYEENGKFYSS